MGWTLLLGRLARGVVSVRSFRELVVQSMSFRIRLLQSCSSQNGNTLTSSCSKSIVGQNLDAKEKLSRGCCNPCSSGERRLAFDMGGVVHLVRILNMALITVKRLSRATYIRSILLELVEGHMFEIDC